MQRYHQGINKTAKRSVTRMSDKTPNPKKENELDPNAKLEKQAFAALSSKVRYGPVAMDRIDFGNGSFVRKAAIGWFWSNGGFEPIADVF